MKDITELLGSWDETLNIPTNATAGALVTGTGEAHSHPHSSNLLGADTGALVNGYYGGGNYAVNITNTSLSCGNNSSFANLPAGANGFTVENWINIASDTPDWSFIVEKGNASTGWFFSIDASGRPYIYIGYQAGIYALLNPSISIRTGKWVHIAFTYSEVDRKTRLYINGYLNGISSATPAGTYTDDSSRYLQFGRNSKNRYGWSRVSNNIRYTTDFIPSRTPPSIDANTIGQWNMTEGTGTTVANLGSAGSAANGTITNGTWVRNWTDEGSVVANNTSVYVKDAGYSQITAGSDVGFNNLTYNQITAEGWFCNTALNSTYKEPSFISKCSAYNNGWRINWYPSSYRVNIYNTLGVATQASFSSGIDYKWHHMAFTFDNNGDRKIRLFFDGNLVATSAAFSGTMGDDSAYRIMLGGIGATRWMVGNIGWVRISNNIRYSSNFIPNSRFNYPSVDANTIGQWNMTEGANLTIDNIEGTATRDGTLAYSLWNNTRDLAIDEPGEQVFAGGNLTYATSGSGGIKQTFYNQTAGSDYVIRALSFTEVPYTGRPKIVIRDETNGNDFKVLNGGWQYEICNNGTFDTDTFWNKGAGWSIAGGKAVHATGNTASIRQDVANQLNGGLITGKLYKITFTVLDMTAGNIVASGATNGRTIVSNGTYVEYLRPNAGIIYFFPSSDFNGSIDNISMIWIPEYNHPDQMICSFELPTVARNGVANDCTSFSVKLLSDTVGEVGWHTCELLPNLLDSGSMDTGAVADPFIPYGWTNYNALDTGDTASESTIVHSSGKSLRINTGASQQGILQNPTLTSGKFYSAGYYGITEVNKLTFTDLENKLKGQASNSQYSSGMTSSTYWKINTAIGRMSQTAPTRLTFYNYASATLIKYIDDAYAFPLDDITLTATPASLANSQESGGIRVDGNDALTQPITKLKSTKGIVKFNYIPRHSYSNNLYFGNSPSYICMIYGNSNNYISYSWTTNSTLRQRLMLNGVTYDDSWSTGTFFTAGTMYKFKIKYTNSGLQLFVDDILRITRIITLQFSTVPAVFYIGTNTSQANTQGDAVFLAP